jgi:5'-nucleotidase
VTERPLALLTNDDGVHAAGIRALRDALTRFADVIIVAPESEQSATSHTLSLHRPLRLRQLEEGIFGVDGSPADCVYLALYAGTRAVPRRPDLVVSGLNHGVNLGSDAFYSGTVGGAREGALRGIPALAASADGDADRAAAALLAAEVAESVWNASRAANGATYLFNLNVPPGSGPWKVRPTILGSRLYAEEVQPGRDPRGREYFWIGGGSVTHGVAPGSDTDAFDRGDASLTPLRLDLTAPEHADVTRRLAESLARR